MATGKLAAASPPATTNTLIYTVPSGKTSVVTVNFCNTSAVSASVRFALSTGASPVDGEWVEYDTAIPAKGVLERGGIVLRATQTIVVYASVAGVNVNVWGYEE